MLNRRAILICLTASAASPAALPAAAQGQAFPFDAVWIAESLGEKRFAPVSRPTLRIARSLQIAGSTGCNRFMGGPAAIEGARLTIPPLATTKMMCFGAGGDNERMFLPAIASTSGWRFERRMLVLETAQGPLRFRRR